MLNKPVSSRLMKPDKSDPNALWCLDSARILVGYGSNISSITYPETEVKFYFVYFLLLLLSAFSSSDIQK
jgi:hypothetical protein